MVRVCEGAKSKQEMLLESVDLYKEVFLKARREFQKVVEVRIAYLLVAAFSQH